MQRLGFRLGGGRRELGPGSIAMYPAEAGWKFHPLLGLESPTKAAEVRRSPRDRVQESHFGELTSVRVRHFMLVLTTL